MALPPLVYDADDDEKIAFYAEVASATSLPLMVYNHPAGGKGDLTPELLARLVRDRERRRRERELGRRAAASPP